MDEPITIWTCPFCKHENIGAGTCAMCYQRVCRVCLAVIYRDESYHSDALVVEHMRCSGGAHRGKPRRAAMGAPHAHVAFERKDDYAGR